MIYKYDNFSNLIKESTEPSYHSLYWDRDVQKILNKDWTDLTITECIEKKNWKEIKVKGKYFIKFKAGDEHFKVIIEPKGRSDLYYLETPETFMKKFSEEFKKQRNSAITFKYDPKVLGSLEHLRRKGNFNL